VSSSFVVSSTSYSTVLESSSDSDLEDTPLIPSLSPCVRCYVTHPSYESENVLSASSSFSCTTFFTDTGRLTDSTLWAITGTFAVSIGIGRLPLSWSPYSPNSLQLKTKEAKTSFNDKRPQISHSKRRESFGIYVGSYQIMEHFDNALNFDRKFVKEKLKPYFTCFMKCENIDWVTGKRSDSCHYCITITVDMVAEVMHGTWWGQS